MTTIDKTCPTCGDIVTVEAPVPGGLGERLSKVYSVLCASCDAEEKAEEKRKLEAIEREKAVARQLNSGIPNDLRSVSFDRLEKTESNRKAIEAARRWAGSNLKGLLIAGPVGTGKTWTAAAACNAMAVYRPVRWFSVSRMLAQARAGFKHPAREDLTEVMLNANLPLIMDDIDKVKATDFARDILFQVIDERVAAGTPLLVTTNFNYTELEAAYGEPIASRLAGMGEAIRIEGSDRRQQR